MITEALGNWRIGQKTKNERESKALSEFGLWAWGIGFVFCGWSSPQLFRKEKEKRVRRRRKKKKKKTKRMTVMSVRGQL